MNLNAFLAQHNLNALNGKLPFKSADELRSLFPEGNTLDQLQLLGLEERKLKRAVETLPFRSNLPTPLALSLKEFHLCTSGAESLWMACNFLEIVLKFCFAAAIAERTETCGALVMPESLVDLISERIDTPGLGEWLKLTEKAVENVGTWNSNTPLQKELLNTVEKVRVLKVTHGMWDTRNRLAHGGWFRRSPVDVDIWRGPFLDFVAKDLIWLERAELLAGAGDKVWLFRGETASVYHSWNHWRRGAIHAGMCRIISSNLGADLDVSPFAATSPAVPLPLMYARWKGSCIEYISYGGLVEWVKEPNRLNNDCFRKNFIRPSFKWLSTPFPDFRDKGQDAISQTESCRFLVNIVDQRIKKGGGGILWVDGVEGSGKSTIMAHLAKRRIDQRDLGKVLTFAYRFESSSFLSRAEYFLHYIYLRLSSAHWNPSTQKWSVSKGTNEAFDPACTVSAEDILDLFKKKTEDPLSMMLFVVDGIDDMIAKHYWFLAEVLSPLTKDSRILFVVSGMHGTPVAYNFRMNGASSVFRDGLPPLTLREFTSVLCTACGDSSTKLLDLQTQAERESHAFAENPEGVAGEEERKLLELQTRAERKSHEFAENPERVAREEKRIHSFGFLAEAHRKGKGLPLYASYLAEDLRSGVIKIGEVDALPEGIEGYHNLQLARTGVLEMLSPLPASALRAAFGGFVAATEMRLEGNRTVDARGKDAARALIQPVDEYLARASVLALMATDSNAVTVDEISQRLGQTVLRGQNAEERSAVLERALEAVSPMLKMAPIDESGREGFELANQSIRRHLNSLPGIQQMAHRFKRRSDDAPPSEPREPKRVDDIPQWERPREDRIDDRPFEERRNTSEMEERVAACISRLESIKRCSEVSEFDLDLYGSGSNDWVEHFFDGTIAEVVAILQRGRSLALTPSKAFKALGQVGVTSDFKWSDHLRDAPSILRNFTWSEPSVTQRSMHPSYRYHLHPSYRYHFGKDWYQRSWDLDRGTSAGGNAFALISYIDFQLNSWVRRVCRAENDGVTVYKIANSRELEFVCGAVADILDLVRDGADLSGLDAFPGAVHLKSRENQFSLARIFSIEFVFRDLPVRVSID